MLLTETKQSALLDAWHGPLTADAIARVNRLSSGQIVQRFWQKAKKDGRLPADRPRPHFADRSAAPLPSSLTGTLRDDDEAELSDADIAREPSLRHALNVEACNASLAALRAAHSDIDQPKFHSYRTAPRRYGGIGG